MTDDARHRHGAVAPWWTKVEFELIIFDIGISRNTSLQTRELEAFMFQINNKYRKYLSSAQMVSDRFGNGWLLSNAEDLACHAFLSSDSYHDVSNEPFPYS